MAHRKALVSIFFAKCSKKQTILVTPLVSYLMENHKMYPYDPNLKLDQGTVGKSVLWGMT